MLIKDISCLDKIMLVMRQAQTIIDEISTSDPTKGYIIAKSAKGVSPHAINKSDPMESVGKGELNFDQYHPFEPEQFVSSEEYTIVPFPSFNQSVDEFYSSVESQKLESKLTEQEETARRRLENARSDHEKRLGGLQQVQELNVRKAQAIEANVPRVQEAIVAVNSLLAQGMDWQNVARLIEVQKQRHNAVAELIQLPLKLYENTVTLLLAEEAYKDEADFEGNETDSDVSDTEQETEQTSRSSKVLEDKRLHVDVDLALSPWSNARQYYDQKKFAAVKEKKTLQSSEKALKNAQRKIGADLKRDLQQEKDLMRPQRTAYWFEKFVFFISSEGYLVLGSKDAQQADILYHRHLKKGDIYVHADLDGAASVVVKNK